MTGEYRTSRQTSINTQFLFISLSVWSEALKSITSDTSSVTSHIRKLFRKSVLEFKGDTRFVEHHSRISSLHTRHQGQPYFLNRMWFIHSHKCCRANQYHSDAHKLSTIPTKYSCDIATQNTSTTWLDCEGFVARHSSILYLEFRYRTKGS